MIASCGIALSHHVKRSIQNKLIQSCNANSHEIVQPCNTVAGILDYKVMIKHY